MHCPPGGLISYPKIEGPLINVISLNGSSKTDYARIRPELKPLVPFLHIESPYFNPQAFLEAFHRNDPADVRAKNVRKIQQFLKSFSDLRFKFIQSNVSQILEVT
jgi:hypothetical protein